MPQILLIVVKKKKQKQGCPLFFGFPANHPKRVPMQTSLSSVFQAKRRDQYGCVFGSQLARSWRMLETKRKLTMLCNVRGWGSHSIPAQTSNRAAKGLERTPCKVGLSQNGGPQNWLRCSLWFPVTINQKGFPPPKKKIEGQISKLSDMSTCISMRSNRAVPPSRTVTNK